MLLLPKATLENAKSVDRFLKTNYLEQDKRANSPYILGIFAEKWIFNDVLNSDNNSNNTWMIQSSSYQDLILQD